MLDLAVWVIVDGMALRTGSADLPLHGGRVPMWLATRMTRLGRVLVEAIVLRYGRRELLRRLSHPFWFQSLGCVMGMDWHSSGITTSVLGALKRGLQPIEWELGVHVCGGRGRHSRETPAELQAFGEKAGIDGGALARTSRLVAKVDSAAVQDGYQLYLHSFIVTDDGDWTVVQQGMDTNRRQARRYHWLSETAGDLIEHPHSAIEGHPRGTILNLTDAAAAPARAVGLELARRDPDTVVHHIEGMRGRGQLSLRLDAAASTPADTTASSAPVAAPVAELLPPAPRLVMPAHHDVRVEDIDLRRLRTNLLAAATNGPADFRELLLVPGVGPRTLFALSLVAEVVHGTPSRFSDPARFSLAHGGKDGHPFPVPLDVYDETLRVMRDAVDRAKLGQSDRLAAIERLDTEARRVQALAEADHAG